MSQIVLIYVSQLQGEKVSLLMTFDSQVTHIFLIEDKTEDTGMGYINEMNFVIFS